MLIMNDDVIFYGWKEAGEYVGDSRLLKEIDELYFHYIGFASVEIEEGTFDRVYVDGYLRLYQADVNELKREMPVTYSSAIIDHNMSINGAMREDLFQKFLVFDDELLIGAGRGDAENEFNYPGDLRIHQSDLIRICNTYGIPPVSESDEIAVSKPSFIEDEDMLEVIGALACMLAMNNDLEGSLQDGQHISEIIIDDLFSMISGLGIAIDGKKKFLYERLITDGVKSILER
ncbi:MAG: hypothetical protein KZQ72_08770 [Candidatus Thiodiazotropha sp. (ex Cardiolucina cf. quadrata)]|nr:hypothetical protein [Candidatus Thiodiazotropha sp. (ex Lucinoma borealis)]MCU7946718.1 hypothetical protein [Candidatus Thiodiazotropha sp. (ex Cardiolucina cf. quadrata)]